MVLDEWLRSADLKTFLIDPNQRRGTGRNAIHRPFRRSRDLPSGDTGILAPLAALACDAAELVARLFPAQEYVPQRGAT